mmetsp:Transcript_19131/g.61552  ORF Transcript_19131/g.61552 Transcript_19131/m.61552 type:complete len:250 (+) Transcript_19131:873-1622(+)
MASTSSTARKVQRATSQRRSRTNAKSRPCVATSGPAASAFCISYSPDPPNTAATFRGCGHSARSVRYVCSHSPRVGDRHSASGRAPSCSESSGKEVSSRREATWVAIGSPKAMVVPEPALASASTSRSAAGMARRWASVGRVTSSRLSRDTSHPYGLPRGAALAARGSRRRGRPASSSLRGTAPSRRRRGGRASAARRPGRRASRRGRSAPRCCGPRRGSSTPRRYGGSSCRSESRRPSSLSKKLFFFP